MACMQEMLHINIHQVVIQIATKCSDLLGPVKLIEMFESFKTFEGEPHTFHILAMYTYIQQVFTTSTPSQFYHQPQGSDPGSQVHLPGEQLLHPKKVKNKFFDPHPTSRLADGT